MKKIFLCILLLPFVSVAQKFNVESVSYQNELPVSLYYLNNPPTGFNQVYSCPDSLSFCVVSGTFAEKLSVPSSKIILTLNTKKKAYLFGYIDDKNLAKISKISSNSDELYGNYSPIFIIPRGSKAVSIEIDGSKINLSTIVKSTTFGVKDIPTATIDSVTLLDKVVSNVNIRSSNAPTQQYVTLQEHCKPVSGKILKLVVTFTSLPKEIYLTEFAVYRKQDFCSNAITDWGIEMAQSYISTGDPAIMYFVVNNDFEGGSLYYHDIEIASFTVQK